MPLVVFDRAHAHRHHAETIGGHVERDTADAGTELLDRHDVVVGEELGHERGALHGGPTKHLHLEPRARRHERTLHDGKDLGVGLHRDRQARRALERAVNAGEHRRRAWALAVRVARRPRPGGQASGHLGDARGVGVHHSAPARTAGPSTSISTLADGASPWPSVTTRKNVSSTSGTRPPPIRLLASSESASGTARWSVSAASTSPCAG